MLGKTKILILALLAACGSGDGDGVPSGAACVSTADCRYDAANVLTCGRFVRTCRVAQEQPLGDTCLADAQCASRACEPNYRYCTTSCRTDADCSAGGLVKCATASFDGRRCRPKCTSDADCAVFRTRGRAAPACVAATGTCGG